MKARELLSRVGWRLRREAATRLVRRPAILRNRSPLISFTFDDFPDSALRVGGEILEHYGYRGTYYASLGLMGSLAPTGRIFAPSDLRWLLDRGQELGCHTFSHSHAWETSAARFEASIHANREALNDLLPGTKFTTLSYPISCPRPATKRRAAQFFTCCRGGGQTYNAGLVDLNLLAAFFLEQSRDNIEAVKQVVDETCSVRGWLIFATHDVAADPTRFGVSPTFFEEVVAHCARSGAVVLPVSQALNRARCESDLPSEGESTTVCL